MTTTESLKGRIILIIAHLAGMIDLVALPVWVGTLMQDYKLDAQHAGGMVTIFLVGVVLASLGFGPRFHRLSARPWAPAAYALAGLSFVGLAFTRDPLLMGLLHGIGGLAVGCGLSFVHGTIGRSANPHRLWAVVGLSLGVFAIAVLGGTPMLVARYGGMALFLVFAGVMGTAALATAVDFPQNAAAVAAPVSAVAAQPAVAHPTLTPPLRWAIAGVVCLTMTQSMMFSFVERIGMFRGFGLERVVGVLIMIGFINLTPAALAGLLQHRLPAERVAIAGPLMQALVALAIALSPAFWPYAVATCLLPFITIFSHNFVFGIIARLDPTGRTLAMTPAMLMTGSAIGPILGGTLVVSFGFGSLGAAAVVIACVGAIAFSRLRGAQPVRLPVVAANT